MAIVISLSGGQLNTQPVGSLGGQRSDTVVVSDTDANFFDDISRSEGLIGKTEYRCGYIYNPDATTYTGVIVELLTNPGITQVSIGLDSAGKGDGRTGGIATSIITEDETPSNVKFFGEENPDDGPYDTVRLPIGMLRQGEGVPFWLKRKTEEGGTQVVTFDFGITHDAVTLPGQQVDDGGAFGELINVVIAASPFSIGTARMGFSEIAPSP